MSLVLCRSVVDLVVWSLDMEFVLKTDVRRLEVVKHRCLYSTGGMSCNSHVNSMMYRSRILGAGS